MQCDNIWAGMCSDEVMRSVDTWEQRFWRWGVTETSRIFRNSLGVIPDATKDLSDMTWGWGHPQSPPSGSPCCHFVLAEQWGVMRLLIHCFSRQC